MRTTNPQRCPQAPPAKPRGRPKSRLCSLNEIAAYLHVSRTTIYRLVDSKGLPYFRIGHLLRFDLPAVLKWAESFTSTGDRLTWQDDYPEMKRAR